ncbi:MAG: hypothetical protein ACOYK5_05980 [Bacteroidia bacterium]|jgi:hypothetical protein
MMRSLLSLLFLGCLCAQAQSAKDLRQANVQSCTVTKIYPTATGKENRLERKEIYDEQGKLKELIRYNSSGDIEKNTLFYFSEKGDWKAEVKLKAGKGLRTDSLVEKKGESGEWERTEHYGKSGKLTYYEIHNWENGLKIKTVRFSPNQAVLFNISYTYQRP